MSKVRPDFVTNSSSSSFVIAKRNDLTLEDCIQAFSQDETIKRLETLIQYDYGCYEYDEDIYGSINYLCQNGKADEAIQLLIPKLASELYQMNTSLELDGWKIGATDVSNEDGDLFRCFLYDAGYTIDTDKIKTTVGD